MTSEEALRYTDKLKLSYSTDSEAKSNIEFILTVREALERDVVKKPIEYGASRKCCMCKEFVFIGQRFCPYCGQRFIYD